MFVKPLVQEADLAWAVADTVRPHLSEVERNAVFVAIGSGETFAAIRGLLRTIETKRIPLEPDLLQKCRTWLRGYGGHQDERHLRSLIEERSIPGATAARTTKRATRIPIRPKPFGLLGFCALKTQRR